MTSSGRTWLLVAAGLLLALVVAGAGAAAAGFRTPPTRIAALFTSTVGLYQGSDVRVLGVKVGKVTDVTPEGGQVRVEMEVDGDVAVAADTGAVIVAPTVVSDRYVQLTEPWTAGPKLESGAVLGAARTAVPVEIDDLYHSVDQVAALLGPDGANSEGDLSRLIKVGARNLDGNGAHLNQLLADLGPAARTLVDTGDDTFATMGNLDRLSEMLIANDQHVTDVNDQLARVLQVMADDREVLSAAITDLSGALVEVEDFIRDNRAHITSSVRNLTSVTRTFVKRKRELSRMLGVLPVTLQNVLDAYDDRNRLFVTRGNPNDVTIWGNPDPKVKHAEPQTPQGRRPLPMMLGDGGEDS